MKKRKKVAMTIGQAAKNVARSMSHDFNALTSAEQTRRIERERVYLERVDPDNILRLK